MRRAFVFCAFLAVFALAGGVSDGAIAPSRTAEASPTTVTVYWGNYTIQGFTQTSSLYIDVQKPCVDCYLTVATPQLEYDNGGTWEVADYTTGAMLHHMVIFNHAYIDPTCGSVSPFNALGDRFFASGNERGTLAFPSGYGYFLPAASADNYWNLNVMIHNLAPVAETFRLAMTFTYQPASDNLKKMRHIWLDENNCSSSQYPICSSGPYPCYDDKHWDWTVGSVPGETFDDIEGTISAIGGHVHDWGISVAAEKVQTGEFICTSVAGYAMGSPYAPDSVTPGNAGHPGAANALNPGDPDYSGHIEDMTGCAPNLKIKAGDTIRLHTQYNADAAIPDVMGIMGAWVYDNCDSVSNPDQYDTDADLLGDPCDPDVDGDTIPNASDPQADGDGLLNTLETACGSDPYQTLSKPERVDGSYAGADEDLDGSIDEALPSSAWAPPPSPPNDCDRDGYGAYAENHVFSYLAGPPMSGDQKRCQDYDTAFPNPTHKPSKRWPSDLNGTAFSLNKVNISDLAAFTNPLRYLGLNVGTDPAVRFDLVPGSVVGAHINVSDMAALTASSASGYPAMLNGARAFGGPVCPT